MNHNSNFFPPNTTPFKYAKKRFGLMREMVGCGGGEGELSPMLHQIILDHDNTISIQKRKKICQNTVCDLAKYKHPLSLIVKSYQRHKFTQKSCVQFNIFLNYSLIAFQSIFYGCCHSYGNLLVTYQSDPNPII